MRELKKASSVWVQRGVAAIPPGCCVLRLRSGGDARSSRNHRLMAGKPPAY